MFWKDVSFEVWRHCRGPGLSAKKRFPFSPLWRIGKPLGWGLKKRECLRMILNLHLGTIVYFSWKQFLIFGYKQFLIVLKLEFWVNLSLRNHRVQNIIDKTVSCSFMSLQCLCAEYFGGLHVTTVIFVCFTFISSGSSRQSRYLPSGTEKSHWLDEIEGLRDKV